MTASVEREQRATTGRRGPWRVGLVGCGAWGRHILRDLKNCGAVVHVADPAAASLREAVSLRADSVAERMAELPPVDGYVVAAPASLHAGIIEALLPSGRPIYTEKPMTADPASARRIAEAAGERVFVMQKWRYHPGIERMRQEVAAGRVGDVLAIRAQRWGWGVPHRDVGALWTLLPHDLSIVLHWLGDLPPLRLVRPMLPASVELALFAELGAPGGPAVTIDLSVVAPEHRRAVTIVGSKASLELCDPYDGAICVRRGAPGDTAAALDSIEIGRDMPLLLSLRAFLAHLAGGPPPMTSAREGALIVERLAEIEAAARAACDR